MKYISILTQMRSAVVASTLLVLAACGGGAPTTVNPTTTTQTSSGSNYTGPAPATADVQAFKLNLWDNLQSDDRCGSCHKPSQTPRFVRSDDINLAYQEANTVVDLANPGLSRMVAKVSGGHHCWLADNAACGDLITRWITAWASVTQGGGGKTIQLVAPTLKDPGASKSFPIDPSLFASTVYPVLVDADKGNCGRCHSADSATKQQPYFATKPASNSPGDLAAAIATSYSQVQTKINLDTPANSRLVLRLRNESHNCWRVGGASTVSCPASATVMENAIIAFANGVTITPIPPEWKVSKALTMYDGTVASGGTRYDNNVIALYEFKTGSGDTAYDTSGIQPALDLTLTNTNAGGYSWVGGWGVAFNGGKAQGLTSTSRKLRDLTASTGEYSIEAWAAPGNVTQEEARIVTYSGGLQTRNVSLNQTLYNYNFFARGNTDPNGNNPLSTPDAMRALQATLQHVVITFDPINGRRIYVNGQYTGTTDRAGTTIGTWDETLVLVLGNEASGNRPWLGTLKLVAIHNRALTPTQVQQNFDAGVGEKYLVLFSVSHLVNMPQAYVMFEVTQYDSYAYLFNQPKLISLDPTALPGSITVKGMRIGINGAEPIAGQAYKPLNVTVTDAMYSSIAGASLSNVGTIVGLERGPVSDEFFLTFEQLGSQINVRTEPAPLAPTTPQDVARPPTIGVRTFDAINMTFSSITGVSPNTVKTTYLNLRQSLPSVENFTGFLASHQIAVAQLAISYCSAMVDNTTLRNAFFPGANFSSNLTTQGDRDLIINPVVNKVSGLTLTSQPDPTQMHDELNLLIDNSAAGRGLGLCRSTACGASRTPTVAKAVCAAGLGSAVSTVQ
jgi:hypothetical protein